MDYFQTETRNHSWINGVPTFDQELRWELMKSWILNPLRKHVDKSCSTGVCVREAYDFQRLINAGFFPSPTSDHYAGNIVDLSGTKHEKKYGKLWRYSTFASDCSFRGLGYGGLRELCIDIYLTLTKKIKENDSRFVHGLVNIKQLILESQIHNGKLKYWLHVSLPYEAIYSREFSDKIKKGYPKAKYLVMKDGKYKLMDFSG